VTTRQDSRPARRIGARGNRAVLAAIVAALAFTLTLALTPGQAQAAIPGAAQTWSALMYRSLTAYPAAVQFRGALTAQQVTFATRAAELATAQAANSAAQARLMTAAVADASARARQTTAQQALTRAKTTLTSVSRHRPRGNAAITRAKSAVAAATATVDSTKLTARQATTALATAQSGARTATIGLSEAIVAWRTASTAIRNTQQKITALGTATVLAGQAAAISRDVVTQIRAGFTVADTTTVYGITVHKSIAFAFKRMLDDAKADGVVLSGSGYRSTQRQIELRTVNGCPDVWTAPPSSCRVPTAIPGRSLHELGLAVDISSGGKTITPKSPGYAWLAAHAAGYGFVNLPSEPWHWSITGS
jgi:D-alanyl-D-alanine carboxypeptidase